MYRLLPPDKFWSLRADDTSALRGIAGVMKKVLPPQISSNAYADLKANWVEQVRSQGMLLIHLFCQFLVWWENISRARTITRTMETILTSSSVYIQDAKELPIFKLGGISDTNVHWLFAITVITEGSPTALCKALSESSCTDNRNMVVLCCFLFDCLFL